MPFAIGYAKRPFEAAAGAQWLRLGAQVRFVVASRTSVVQPGGPDLTPPDFRKVSIEPFSPDVFEQIAAEAFNGTAGSAFIVHAGDSILLQVGDKAMLTAYEARVSAFWAEYVKAVDRVSGDQDCTSSILVHGEVDEEPLRCLVRSTRARDSHCVLVSVQWFSGGTSIGVSHDQIVPVTISALAGGLSDSIEQQPESDALDESHALGWRLRSIEAALSCAGISLVVIDSEDKITFAYANKGSVIGDSKSIEGCSCQELVEAFGLHELPGVVRQVRRTDRPFVAGQSLGAVRGIVRAAPFGLYDGRQDGVVVTFVPAPEDAARGMRALQLARQSLSEVRGNLARQLFKCANSGNQEFSNVLKQSVSFIIKHEAALASFGDDRDKERETCSLFGLSRAVEQNWAERLSERGIRLHMCLASSPEESLTLPVSGVATALDWVLCFFEGVASPDGCDLSLSIEIHEVSGPTLELRIAATLHGAGYETEPQSGKDFGLFVMGRAHQSAWMCAAEAAFSALDGDVAIMPGNGEATVCVTLPVRRAKPVLKDRLRARFHGARAVVAHSDESVTAITRKILSEIGVVCVDAVDRGAISVGPNEASLILVEAFSHWSVPVHEGFEIDGAGRRAQLVIGLHDPELQTAAVQFLERSHDVLVVVAPEPVLRNRIFRALAPYC